MIAELPGEQTLGFPATTNRTLFKVTNASIINFDLRLLQSTPDLRESPGTVWVYLSRKIIYSWFTSWNDGDKAEDFRNNLLIRINRLPMNSDVRDKILKIFREVTYSLMFRKKIIDDSSGGVP